MGRQGIEDRWRSVGPWVIRDRGRTAYLRGDGSSAVTRPRGTRRGLGRPRWDDRGGPIDGWVIRGRRPLARPRALVLRGPATAPYPGRVRRSALRRPLATDRSTLIPDQRSGTARYRSLHGSPVVAGPLGVIAPCVCCIQRDPAPTVASRQHRHPRRRVVIAPLASSRDPDEPGRKSRPLDPLTHPISYAAGAWEHRPTTPRPWRHTSTPSALRPGTTRFSGRCCGAWRRRRLRSSKPFATSIAP